jgi:hypothetical protein
MTFPESDPVALVLSRAKGVQRTGSGYKFLCQGPGHKDTRYSGFVMADPEGNAILKCFTKCDRKTVCAGLGIRESDLYVNQQQGYRAAYRTNQIVYAYHNSEGTLIYEHIRTTRNGDKKIFFYRRPEVDGAHCWSLHSGWFERQRNTWKRVKNASNKPDQKPHNGARWFAAIPRLLYRLRQVKEVAPGSLIIYCEGEKDVHTAERLGFVATTGGGASDWRSEFAKDIVGLNLVVIADNDIAGRLCATKVARDCLGKAACVRIVDLPGLGKSGDLTDWVQAGHTREELLELIDATALWQPADSAETDEEEVLEPEGDDPPISTDPDRVDHLYQIARSGAEMLKTNRLLLVYLGFRGNHNRLLNALLSRGADNLRPYSCKLEWLVEQYTANGEKVSSEKTISRDIHKLLIEQHHLGIEIVKYWQGYRNDATGRGIVSRFQNLFVRYALEAINEAIESSGDYEYSWKALDAACKKVAARILKQRDERGWQPEEPEPEKEKPVNPGREKQKAITQIEKYLEILLAQGKEIEMVEGEAQEIFFEALGRALKKAEPEETEFVLPDKMSTYTNLDEEGEFVLPDKMSAYTNPDTEDEFVLVDKMSGYTNSAEQSPQFVLVDKMSAYTNPETDADLPVNPENQITGLQTQEGRLEPEGESFKESPPDHIKAESDNLSQYPPDISILHELPDTEIRVTHNAGDCPHCQQELQLYTHALDDRVWVQCPTNPEIFKVLKEEIRDWCRDCEQKLPVAAGRCAECIRRVVLAPDEACSTCGSGRFWRHKANRNQPAGFAWHCADCKKPTGKIAFYEIESRHVDNDIESSKHFTRTEAR